MGLGKSLLTLEVLRRVHEQGQVRGCADLIIAPKLCQEQWLEEVNQAYDGVSVFPRIHLSLGVS